MNAIFQTVRQRERLPAIWAAVLVVSFLLMFSGCGNSPTEPPLDQSIQDQGPSMVSAFDREQPFEPKTVCRTASGEVTVEHGGLIRFDWGGPRNRLYVAPGAVSEDMTVTVNICRTRHPVRRSGDDFVELEFLPDGAQFSPPAVLTLRARSLLSNPGLRGRDGQKLKLYYLNPETASWELLQEATIKRGLVQFKLNHFSKYGISS